MKNAQPFILIATAALLAGTASAQNGLNGKQFDGPPGRIRLPLGGQPPVQEQTEDELLEVMNESVGAAITVSGDLSLSGYPITDGNAAGSGTVFAYRRQGLWGASPPQQLNAADGETGDGFGAATAVDTIPGLIGSRAIVGAIGDDDMGTDAGAVYAFEYDGTAWVPDGKLLEANTAAGDMFGRSLSVSGDRALIGSIGAPDAYVFERQGPGTWTRVAVLSASDAQASGYSVALDGDTAIVGRYTGAAFIYERLGPVWTEVAALIGVPEELFGISVAIDGESAVVGAPGDPSIDDFPGAAFVFERGAMGNWDDRTTLRTVDADGLDVSDSFGRVVAIDGNRVVVGATEDFVEGRGSAYLFKRAGPGWVATSRLVAEDSLAFRRLGAGLSIAGDQVFAAGADSYVFEVP